MYSTVGAAEMSCRRLTGVLGEKCGKGVVEVCGNGCEAEEKGGKDVVKMVTYFAQQNSTNLLPLPLTTTYVVWYNIANVCRNAARKGLRMEIVLLVHILCIIAGCYFGAQKGRALFGFLLGALFGVLGLIVLMFFPKRKSLKNDKKS